MSAERYTPELEELARKALKDKTLWETYATLSCPRSGWDAACERSDQEDHPFSDYHDPIQYTLEDGTEVGRPAMKLAPIRDKGTGVGGWFYHFGYMASLSTVRP